MPGAMVRAMSGAAHHTMDPGPRTQAHGAAQHTLDPGLAAGWSNVALCNNLLSGALAMSDMSGPCQGHARVIN